MSVINGRQVAKGIDGIREDHVNRYRWAIDAALPKPPANYNVMDLGCGCGYGSFMLACAGYNVQARDSSQEALTHAKQYFDHGNIVWRKQDLEKFGGTGTVDAYVCFEVLEHLKNAEKVLAAAAKVPGRVFVGSVPNGAEVDQSHHEYHVNDFDEATLLDMLRDSGWVVTGVHGQRGKRGKDAKVLIGNSLHAKTLLFTAVSR